MQLMPDLTKPTFEQNSEGSEHLEVSSETLPLDFLCAIFRDARQPMARRMRAAIAAAPFKHPKLAVAVHVVGGNLGDLLDRAYERMSGNAAEVIDAPPVGQSTNPLPTELKVTNLPEPSPKLRRI